MYASTYKQERIEGGEENVTAHPGCTWSNESVALCLNILFTADPD